MSRLLVAERNAGVLSFAPLEGDGAGESFDALLMSRLDFDLAVLEIPPAAAKEVAGFLRYRIPSLYPGNPEETAFDYRLLDSGGRTWAVLFLCHKHVLEEYRQAAGGKPLLLPFSLLHPLAALPRPASRRGRPPAPPAAACFWHRAWIDVLVSGEGGPRTFVVVRGGDAGRDLEQVLRQAPEMGEGARWRMFCGEADRAALPGRLEQGPAPGAAVEILPHEAALARLNPRREALFAEGGRSGGRVPRALRVQLLAALALALALLAFSGSVGREERYRQALRAHLDGLEKRLGHVVGLQKEVEGLAAELAALQAVRPVDPYRVLSGLEAVLRGGIRIESFLLERRFFQLEAVGRNPLRLMEEFARSGAFEEVKMIQVVPLAEGGGERFKITGRVRE